MNSGPEEANGSVPPAEETPKETENREPETMTVKEMELEQQRREATEYKDKYFRLLAESENARKRLQKERQEMTQYAVQNIIVDFLNPIDHLENALKYADQGSEEVKMWAIGFQMILNQFKDVLSTNGVVAVPSEGAVFDPHYHEAIEMVITTEYPAGTVVAETLKGYKMGERIIRPARVKVAKAPAAPRNEETAAEPKE